MRIGINLLCILPGINGGVETYAVSTLRALAARDRSNEYFVFVNRQGAGLDVLEAPNITPVVCNFDARPRELRYAWEQLLLPRASGQYRLDLLHSPGYQGPLRCHCPTVVTLPDLNFIAFRDTLPWHRRMALEFFCPRAARRAAGVITISHFSKSEIVKYLGVPPEKITVTHLGPGILPTPADWDVVRAKLGLDVPYIVAYAGNNYPHKNMSRLFEAFGKVRTSEPVYLAVIGGLSPELKRFSERLRGRVLDLKHVDSACIEPILSHARLCVLPSLYEGFGLPVLEAQSAGVPLLCSNAASLPEVAGQGAMFFDPLSVDQIALSIERCLGDRACCEALIRAGRENVKRFSWDKAADQTLAVYNQVVAGQSPVEPAFSGAAG